MPRRRLVVQERDVPFEALRGRYPTLNSLALTSSGLDFSSPTTCCICLEEGFPAASPRAFLSSCAHDFHFACIAEQCKSNESKCPECRRVISYLAVIRIVSGSSLADAVLGVRETGVKKRVQKSHYSKEYNDWLYGSAAGADVSRGSCAAVYASALQCHCTYDRLQAICYVCKKGDREEDLLVCDAECNGGAHYDCLGFSELPTGDWFCRQPGCRGESDSSAAVGGSAAPPNDAPHHPDRSLHVLVGGRRRDNSAAPTSGRGRRRRISTSAVVAPVCDEGPSAAVAQRGGTASSPSEEAPAALEPRRRRRRLPLGDSAPRTLGDGQGACTSEHDVCPAAQTAASVVVPPSVAETPALQVSISDADGTAAEIVSDLLSSNCGVAVTDFPPSGELAEPSPTAHLVPVPSCTLPASRLPDASCTAPVSLQPETPQPASRLPDVSSAVPHPVRSHPESAPPASSVTGISSVVPSRVPTKEYRTPPPALSTTVVVSMGKKSRVFVRDARGVIDLSDSSDDSDDRGDGLPSPRLMNPLLTSRASSPAPCEAPLAMRAPGGVTAEASVASDPAAAAPTCSDLLSDSTRTLFTLLDRASSNVIDVVVCRWLASQLRAPFLTAPAAVHSIVRSCNLRFSVLDDDGVLCPCR